MDFQSVVMRAKENDKSAMEEVIKKFNPLIIKMATSTFIAGYEFEDLKQIGYMSIIRAVNMINIEKSASCEGYIVRAVRNNFFYEIRRKVNDQYVGSLNKISNEGIELGEFLSSDFNVEDECINIDEKKRLKLIVEGLGEAEKELIFYILKYHKGGVLRYSKDKGISYSTCIKRRDKIFKKIRQILV